MGNLKKLTVILLILGSNTIALAQGPQSNQVNRAAQEKITLSLKAAVNEKGLMSKSLTPEKIQQIRETTQQLQRGGVSDGGGNAVGTTLFDFYENEGSQELSIVELLNSEPLAKEMILALDREIPAVGRLSSIGFGSLLLVSVQGKKIFLENKEISSAGCKNESMVAASQQMIVACQSDTEIRFNATWLSTTDARNRAGLIMHEMILGWARKQGGGKAKTEAAVRRLNRLLFTVERSQYAQAVKDVFNVHTFSAESFLRTQSQVKISLAALTDYKKRTHALDKAQRMFLSQLATAISSGTLNSGECFVLFEMGKEVISDVDANKICAPLTEPRD
ncbi:hypothetical protein D3C87_240770 [compost metagenome]